MTRSGERLIVCGGGLGGLSAAVTALERGARVTLLEKAPELGGTTLLSGGLLWTFGDYDEARAKIPHGDAALQWLVYDNLEAGRAWLAGLGVKLGPMERVLFHGLGQSLEPAQVVKLLAERFTSLGGELRLATALDSLITRDGQVSGVRAVHDGRHEDLAAGAVVLATGGFQGNPELLARYVVPDPDNLLLRANPWSTGDAFIAALAIGAAASPGLDNFYGHAIAAPPARYRWDQLRDVSQYHGFVSVALNRNGERFADETEMTGEEALNQRLARQPRGQGVYVVDERVMELQPIQGRPSICRSIIERARAAGGTVLEAASLEELCAQLAPHGFPAARCLASLTEFNRCMAQDRADELHPPRTLQRFPLSTPPFRAVIVQAAITFTTGGLAIDERTRVVRRAGSSSPYSPAPVSRAYSNIDGAVNAIGNDYRQTVIPGLYAVGCDAGNISHFGYMGGLSSALTTGRVAGQEAAERVCGAQN